ncbi:MAG: OmpA family protein [Idiomarina sp.]|nr:OmpA family protein [Idiomarina sp.]
MDVKSGVWRLGLLGLGLVVIQSAALANNLSESAHPFFGVRLTALNPDDSRRMVNDNIAYPYRNNFESPGFGLQYGIAWNHHWQLRSYYDRIRMNVSEGQPNVWGHSYGVDALYRFDSGVYTGVGLNSTRTNQQRDPMLRASLGYQVELLDRFFTSLEYNLQSESQFTDHLVSWSLNYRFGRDMDTQTLPREFRQRRQQRSTQSAPTTRRASATPSRPVSTADSLAELRQPPADLPFAFNSAQLDQVWYGAVGRIADILMEKPSLSLVLIGHSDLTGETDYNLYLSQRRANYVASLLVEDFAVPAERIKTTGVGMQDPLIEQVGRSANAKNRRVEILFQTSDSSMSGI